MPVAFPDVREKFDFFTLTLAFQCLVQPTSTGNGVSVMEAAASLASETLPTRGRQAAGICV
jgi:hypothetical protein